MAIRELPDDERPDPWLVYEVKPSYGSVRAGVRAEFAEGWLCFQSEAEKRRLAPFPTNWEELDPTALLILLQRATRAEPRCS